MVCTLEWHFDKPYHNRITEARIIVYTALKPDMCVGCEKWLPVLVHVTGFKELILQKRQKCRFGFIIVNTNLYLTT